MLADGERREKINGVAHWLRVAGAGRRTTPLVIFHGGPGGNTYNFERTVGQLLEAFATVVSYDQRVCGRSAEPDDPDAYSIPILCDDLDGLRQALGLQLLIPLGFSFGGELALEYALRYPGHVERLILQAPSLNDPLRAYVQVCGFLAVARGELRDRIRTIADGDGTVEDRLDRIWREVDSNTVDRFLFRDRDAARLNRELWRESGLVNSGAMVRALRRHPPRRPPLLDELGRIDVPSLVLVGLHDRNVGVDACRDVAAALPKARLVIFENSAHFPDIEESERYAVVVRDFLRVGGRAGRISW